MVSKFKQRLEAQKAAQETPEPRFEVGTWVRPTDDRQEHKGLNFKVHTNFWFEAMEKWIVRSIEGIGFLEEELEVIPTGENPHDPTYVRPEDDETTEGETTV